MIIKFTSIRLIFIPCIVLIFPFIQKQWLNLYLFNSNSFSVYSILYYLSGLILPLIIIFNSINNFTYYDFKKIRKKNINVIKGKKLLCLILFVLFSLTYLVASYFYINLDLFIKLILNKNNLFQVDFTNQLLLMFLIGVLLIFRNTRILIKNVSLLNFLFISIFIWYSQINNFFIDNEFLIKEYINLNNINFINIIFLLTIESFYYLWSFLSYKNNLSDWSVNIPIKNDILSFFKIIIFYIFVIVYYSILE